MAKFWDSSLGWVGVGFPKYYNDNAQHVANISGFIYCKYGGCALCNPPPEKSLSRISEPEEKPAKKTTGID